MIDLTKITDPYERKARLYPALICLFPIMVSVSVSYPMVFTTLSGFVALGAAVGFLQFISHLARDRGKRLEAGLFESWGAMPSVAILRHSDNTIPTPAKKRYHTVLAMKSKINAPSEQFEKDQPVKADEIYQSWSDFLRGKTRNTIKYSLLFKENINYGFRRNLLGIRLFCILSGFLSIILLTLPSFSSLEISGIQIAIFLIELLYLTIFLFVVNPTWVKTVAFAYSKNLIEAINI